MGYGESFLALRCLKGDHNRLFLVYCQLLSRSRPTLSSLSLSAMSINILVTYDVTYRISSSSSSSSTVVVVVVVVVPRLKQMLQRVGRRKQKSSALVRIVRPSDIVVGGLMFYHGFVRSFFYSSPSNLRSRWAELNHIWPHGRKCDLKTHVRNLGYPLPLQIGGPNPLFDDFAT